MNVALVLAMLVGNGQRQAPQILKFLAIAQFHKSSTPTKPLYGFISNEEDQLLLNYKRLQIDYEIEKQKLEEKRKKNTADMIEKASESSTHQKYLTTMFTHIQKDYETSLKTLDEAYVVVLKTMQKEWNVLKNQTNK